jgi:hypothetical protein
MGLYSTVDCYEVHGSVRQGYSFQSGQTASVQLRVLTANVWALIIDVVGARRIWPQGSGLFGARAQSAEVEPIPEEAPPLDAQGLDYEWSWVTINYAVTDKDSDTEDLVSESLEPTAEFITLNPREFRWTDANGAMLDEDEAPGRMIRGLQLSRTLYKIGPILPTSIIDNVGCVNPSAYTSTLIGLTFPTGTLLYTPPTLTRSIKSDGTGICFDVNLKFVYKKETWNKFWRAKSQMYESLYNTQSSSAYINYPDGDFSDLLF